MLGHPLWELALPLRKTLHQYVFSHLITSCVADRNNNDNIFPLNIGITGRARLI